VDDKTVGDNQVYGLPVPTYPLYLVFLGDVDGDGDAFLAEAASRAAAGLGALFSCCDGFTPGADLLAWMRAHSVAPAANYVNWLDEPFAGSGKTQPCALRSTRT
jgi:hypothetical protein